MSQFHRIQVDFLHLCMHLPVRPYFLQNTNQSDDLHQISTHHNYQDYHIIRSYQIPVVPFTPFSVEDQENESGSEETEKTCIEYIAFSFAKLFLFSDPSYHNSEWVNKYKSKVSRRKRKNSRRITKGLLKCLGDVSAIGMIAIARRSWAARKAI